METTGPTVSGKLSGLGKIGSGKFPWQSVTIKMSFNSIENGQCSCDFTNEQSVPVAHSHSSSRRTSTMVTIVTTLGLANLCTTNICLSLNKHHPQQRPNQSFIFISNCFPLLVVFLRGQSTLYDL